MRWTIVLCLAVACAASGSEHGHNGKHRGGRAPPSLDALQKRASGWMQRLERDCPTSDPEKPECKIKVLLAEIQQVDDAGLLAEKLRWLGAKAREAHRDARHADEHTLAEIKERADRWLDQLKGECDAAEPKSPKCVTRWALEKVLAIEDEAAFRAALTKVRDEARARGHDHFKAGREAGKAHAKATAEQLRAHATAWLDKLKAKHACPGGDKESPECAAQGALEHALAIEDEATLRAKLREIKVHFKHIAWDEHKHAAMRWVHDRVEAWEAEHGPEIRRHAEEAKAQLEAKCGGNAACEKAVEDLEKLLKCPKARKDPAMFAQRLREIVAESGVSSLRQRYADMVHERVAAMKQELEQGCEHPRVRASERKRAACTHLKELSELLELHRSDPRAFAAKVHAYVLAQVAEHQLSAGFEALDLDFRDDFRGHAEEVAEKLRKECARPGHHGPARGHHGSPRGHHGLPHGLDFSEFREQAEARIEQMKHHFGGHGRRLFNFGKLRDEAKKQYENAKREHPGGFDKLRDEAKKQFEHGMQQAREHPGGFDKLRDEAKKQFEHGMQQAREHPGGFDKLRDEAKAHLGQAGHFGVPPPSKPWCAAVPALEGLMHHKDWQTGGDEIKARWMRLLDQLKRAKTGAKGGDHAGADSGPVVVSSSQGGVQGTEDDSGLAPQSAGGENSTHMAGVIVGSLAGVALLVGVTVRQVRQRRRRAMAGVLQLDDSLESKLVAVDSNAQVLPLPTDYVAL